MKDPTECHDCRNIGQYEVSAGYHWKMISPPGSVWKTEKCASILYCEDHVPTFIKNMLKEQSPTPSVPTKEE